MLAAINAIAGDPSRAPCCKSPVAQPSMDFSSVFVSSPLAVSLFQRRERDNELRLESAAARIEFVSRKNPDFFPFLFRCLLARLAGRGGSWFVEGEAELLSALWHATPSRVYILCPIITTIMRLLTMEGGGQRTHGRVRYFSFFDLSLPSSPPGSRRFCRNSREFCLLATFSFSTRISRAGILLLHCVSTAHHCV